MLPSSSQSSLKKSSVDKFGLPLSRNEATPVASCASNSLGEVPSNRSMGMAASMTPSLYGEPSFAPRLSMSAFSTAAPKLVSNETSLLKKSVLITSASTSKPSNWKISPGVVACKFPCYPLDPQSRMVMKSNASDIAARISDCLRRRSIAAKFNTDKAKAKCTTADGVEFRIRLFAGVGKYTGGVIVELQRRSGWAASYHQDCLAILESAECDLAGDGDDHQLEDEFYPGDLVTSFSDRQKNLGLAKLLLSSGNVESILLGVENVCSLTDIRKCGRDTALQTARALFLDRDNYQVQETLRNIIINNAIHCADISGTELNRARSMALNTIMNAATVLSRSGEFEQALMCNTWMESCLVSSSMRELNNIADPHKGAIAARLLNVITTASVKATQKAIELGALQILETAHETGVRTHARLAYETHKMQQTFQVG